MTCISYKCSIPFLVSWVFLALVLVETSVSLSSWVRLAATFFSWTESDTEEDVDEDEDDDRGRDTDGVATRLVFLLLLDVMTPFLITPSSLTSSVSVGEHEDVEEDRARDVSVHEKQ